ncbi:MAG: GTPase HflX, partial [Planctomycetes bacterium]|nr:GTPase HflX [Planctomycetota bacterium]
QSHYKDCIVISAKTHHGIQDLKRKIVKMLERNFSEVEVSCSQSNGKLIAYLHEHAHILDSRFEEQLATFRLLMDEKLIHKLRVLDSGIQIKALTDTGSN